MATKKKHIIIKLKCEKCKRINYYLRKKKKSEKSEKKAVPDKPSASAGKLEIKKFCNWCKKHVLHKEGR